MPGVRVLVTGIDVKETEIIDSILVGAKGFISELASGAQFANAIRIIHRGLIWAPRSLLAAIIRRVNDVAPRRSFAIRGEMSKREREVLRMLVAGKSNKEIAHPLISRCERLRLTFHT